MPARLIDALATTAPLAELFSDRSVLQAMLEFEAALAQAEAKAGVIPRPAAKVIADAARAGGFDISALAYDTFRAGTPGIPISKALAEAVRKADKSAASFVHWGATSQDVADTALALLLKRALPILRKDLARIEGALQMLSEDHKNTVMLGRTLLQPAPPITLGLKAAGWFAGVRRGREALEAAFADALVIQFGGASGTLASLGKYGPAVARALAEELGLQPAVPWHTQRDRLARLVCSCGVLVGTLGKLARDISLLMQNEVAEAEEPGGAGRGGSSTMPHKRNPIACSLTLAAAARAPGQVAAFLAAMIQEHERGVGGWQSEWPIVASVVQATGVAAESMAEVAEGLSVDAKRMLANLEATQGAVFAERAAMLLASRIGRPAAHQLIEKAARESARSGRHLAEVLAKLPEVTKHLPPAMLRDLELPERYLGSAEEFRAAQLLPAKNRKRRK